jgi:hypothetical protein
VLVGDVKYNATTAMTAFAVLMGMTGMSERVGGFNGNLQLSLFY